MYSGWAKPALFALIGSVVARRAPVAASGTLAILLGTEATILSVAIVVAQARPRRDARVGDIVHPR